MFEKILKSVFSWFVVVLVCYALITIYHYNYHEHLDWNSFYQIASHFLTGFINSAVFYFVVVYLPSKRRRSIVKIYFNAVYKQIRHTLIRQILFCSKEGGNKDVDVTEDLVEKLCDVREFRDFFRAGEGSNEGWYSFCNNIQRQPADFKILTQELRFLAKEINYILHCYDIKSKEHYIFFKNLETLLITFCNLDINHFGDEVKTICGILWQICAGWDGCAEGYRDYDLIEKIIDEI